MINNKQGINESWKIVAAYFSGTGPPEETYNYRSFKLTRNLPAEEEKINKPRNLPFILIILTVTLFDF